MAKVSKQASAVNRWRKAQEPRVTIQALCDAIGDTGGQLAKWLSGSRTTTPLRLKCKLAQHTGLPLSVLVDSQELTLARDVFAAMARDAATAA